MTALTVTVVGDDRPGIVSELSAPIESHGASWERSQMARLGGKFAGIVSLSVPEDRVDALVADLSELRSTGLQVVAERADQPVADEVLRFHLELLGADHPGIVAEVSAALADLGVSIEELSTDVRDASMAGGTVFEAQAVLVAAPGTEIETLRPTLEGLADDLMVEISLSDA